MFRVLLVAAVTFLAFPAFSSPALAEQTKVTVRVISKGAKFIGDSMGGVAIKITDADTGEVLAAGTTKGNTGDTKRIMSAAPRKGETLATPGAAEFTATLNLEEPRRIQVTATGPEAQRQSAATVSSTQWVVPGKHIVEGDAWLLEMPGLSVSVLSPAPAGKAPMGPVKLSAHVVMMCGCPITPGGTWDADKLEVKAIVKRNGKKSGEITLKYAGKASHFEGSLEPQEPGSYELIVYAYDPASGNTGLSKTTVEVEAAASPAPGKQP
jgi:hypothetical protein